MAAEYTRQSSERGDTITENWCGFSDQVARKAPASSPERFRDPSENVKQSPRDIIQISHGWEAKKIKSKMLDYNL